MKSKLTFNLLMNIPIIDACFKEYKYLSFYYFNQNNVLYNLSI